MLHTMMTSQILFFSLLPAFVYAADAQVTLPRDPLCACTVNAPPGSRDCGQPYGYGADDNCVKKSAFLALQTLVKELQQELATTKAGFWIASDDKAMFKTGLGRPQRKRCLDVEGYCRGLQAGDVRVGWNIGDCVNQNPHYDVGNSLTGWKSTVRITVEEVNVEDANEKIS